MALRTEDDQQSRIDKGYNDGLNSNRDAYKGAQLDQYESDVSAPPSDKSLDESERDSEWKTSINKEHSKKASPKISIPSTKSLLKNAKQKSAIAFILTAILVGLVTGGGFLSLALGPIAFVENVVDDLNDQLASMRFAGDGILRSKIPSSDRKEALKGCTKLSIRCKFKTLSNRQVQKLKAHGIEVVPSTEYKNLVGLDRTVPAGYKFQGRTYSADEWASELNSNRDAKRAQLRANNMKYLGVSDTTFAKNVLKRFGITKKPPELKGSHQDRVNALMNKTNSTNAKDIRFTPIDLEGNPVEEGSKNHTGYKLEGDPSGKHYSKSEYETIQGSIGRIKNTRPISNVTKYSIGAFSALGLADLACSMKNMVGGAAVASKVINQSETIQYSMGIISKVHEMKAGDISPEDASAIGEYFMGTDARKEIPDIESGIGENSKADELKNKPNPNYGKNALDSELYKMSTGGGVAKPNPTVSVGMGQNTVLANFSGAAAAVNSVSDGGCKVVQNWGVRILGIAATVALGIGSSGATLAWQAAQAAAMIGGLVMLENALKSWMDGSIIESANLDEDTTTRGDITWTGVSGIMGASAQARGLTPGTSDQIIDNMALSQQVNNDYASIEREDADPFDVYNQYSFIGSAARTLLGKLPTSITAASFFSNLPSLVSKSILSPLHQSVSAKSIDPKRFKLCDDEAYTNIGIDADVQCNVRYVIPKDAYKLGPDDTALWMEDNNYVEKDSTTGYPKGYTPPEPAASQGAIVDFVKGTADGFVGQFINQRVSSIEDYNDYAKFLDYCAYRIMPFGETFEDDQPINGVGSEWTTGKKCMENSSMLNHFRMYTLYISTNSAIDGDGEV